MNEVFRFFDQINSPGKLLAYLRSLQVSEVSNTGVSGRRELNESVSAILRMVLRKQPSSYAFHPQLRPTLLKFILEEWRDPETGFWGAWFRTKNGELHKTDDLSMTFHIISYLNGDVPDLDKVMSTTLAMKKNAYPYGWLTDGTVYENHHNYDVVKLLRLAWSHSTETQKGEARGEIEKMLKWCLSESVGSDGSFVRSKSDESIEDSFYFGVSFLNEVGYFDPARRFWTGQEFEGAEKLLQTISQSACTKLAQGKSGPTLRNTLKKLNTVCKPYPTAR